MSFSVCVAVESKYNDNNGAYDIGYFFDGHSVSVESNLYSDKLFKVDATPEQIRKASIAYMEDEKNADYAPNKYLHNGRRGNTFIGCKVVLQRSRKAPNKVELLVTDFYEGGYNSRFGGYEADKIKVTDGADSWVVSVSCIKDVTKKVTEKPFWYMSEEDLKALSAKPEQVEQVEDKPSTYDADVKAVAHCLSLDIPEDTKTAVLREYAENNNISFDKFLSDVLKVA